MNDMKNQKVEADREVVLTRRTFIKYAGVIYSATMM